LGSAEQCIHLALTDLSWTSLGIGASLKTTKTMPVKFFYTAIRGLLGTAQLSRRGAYALVLIDIGNYAVPLSDPDWQFSIMKFCEEHLFLTTPKPSELDSFWHRYAPSLGAYIVAFFVLV